MDILNSKSMHRSIVLTLLWTITQHTMRTSSELLQRSWSPARARAKKHENAMCAKAMACGWLSARSCSVPFSSQAARSENNRPWTLFLAFSRPGGAAPGRIICSSRTLQYQRWSVPSLQSPSPIPRAVAPISAKGNGPFLTIAKFSDKMECTKSRYNPI